VRDKHSNQKTSTSEIQPINEKKSSFLAQTTLFKPLDSSTISELDHLITTSAGMPGRIFYRPGDTATTLFVLKSGCVQLYHLSTDGRKLVTATLTEGMTFGETALFGQQQRTTFAEAIEDTLVYTIHKADLEQLCLQKPTFTYALLQLVGQRLLQIETKLLNTTFKSTTARLAELLLQVAQPADSATSPLTVDGLSHEELADRLGVYRETVSTALRELRESGMIKLGRKHITISKPAQLQQLAMTDSKTGLHSRE
jgi:CRP-like cAMP-binding protein